MVNNISIIYYIEQNEGGPRDVRLGDFERIIVEFCGAL